LLSKLKSLRIKKTKNSFLWDFPPTGGWAISFSFWFWLVQVRLCIYNMRKTITVKNNFVLATLIILSLAISWAGAQPPLPSGFHGSLTINGAKAPVGAVVSAWIKGVHYPTDFTVSIEGVYGIMLITADDPTTPTKEGGVPGDIIDFRIKMNEYTLFAKPNGIWQGNGVNQKLDLSADGEVPVELVSFDYALKDNLVELRWSTATESNNLGFEVQKSTDKIVFSTIGFVPGNGTTVDPHTYHFINNDLSPAQYAYRIKQLDIAGTFSYSPILEVSILPPAKFELFQNYPNPFNPETHLQFALPRDEQVRITIYDLQGQMVRTIVKERKAAGTYQVVWDSRDENGVKVTSGVYFYRIQAGEFTMTKKMLLMK
jgi:hypothetical protein